MENISQVLSKLREQIQALPLSKAGKRMGINPELRESIVLAYSSSGLNSEMFCKEIGISYSCFAKWKSEFNSKNQKPLERGGFKQIKIDSPQVPNVSEKIRLIVEGPQGLRITGLSMSEVCLLWRSLC
jgi:transposase-like protein